MHKDSTIVKPLAPEDIRPGDYLAVMHEVDEYLPIGALLDCSAFNQPRSLQPVQVQWLPCGECVPLKVKAVCLPFVLVKAPRPQPLGFLALGRGGSGPILRTLDVRRCRLARLSHAYGKRVFKLLQERASKKRAAAGCSADDF